MKVAIATRRDADRKGGGDVQQALTYAELITARGHEAVVVDSGAAVAGDPSVDLVHLFNTDRPVELIASSSALLRADKPYVVSTVHHSFVHLREFYRLRPGALGVLERRLPRSLADFLKHVARYRPAPAPLTAYPTRGAVRRCLERAAGVLCLAQGEADWLAADYRYAGPVQVLPNGATTRRPAAGADIDVIVLGRVELRKNQLAVARALQGTPYRVLFLGAPNMVDPAYVRAFEAAVLASPNVSWVRGVPASEVPRYLARSRVALSASFFEVLSLADLEAAAAGCVVVASERGNTHELLGARGAFYVDPYDLTGLPETLQDALSAVGPELPRHLPTWEDIGAELLRFYLSRCGAGR